MVFSNCICSIAGEYPYMALLVYQDNGIVRYGCGGSVINRWYVLTAAHCHQQDSIQQAILGEYRVS